MIRAALLRSLALALFACALPALAQTARVSNVSGEVAVTANGGLRQARNGDVLQRGDRISTLDGSASLRFDDGSTVNVGPHSMLVVLGSTRPERRGSASDTVLECPADDPGCVRGRARLAELAHPRPQPTPITARERTQVQSALGTASRGGALGAASGAGSRRAPARTTAANHRSAPAAHSRSTATRTASSRTTGSRSTASRTNQASSRSRTTASTRAGGKTGATSSSSRATSTSSRTGSRPASSGGKGSATGATRGRTQSASSSHSSGRTSGGKGGSSGGGKGD